MATFVHLTATSRARNVLRSGFKVGKGASGLFAMPVVENYLVTHQWTRELMKWRRQPMAGIYFRIPDETVVLMGHFGRPHRRMTAAQAVAAVRAAEDPFGFECILQPPLADLQIVRTAPIRGVVGWRHYPGAHGVRPFCTCDYCTKGTPNGARLRRRLRALETR